MINHTRDVSKLWLPVAIQTAPGAGVVVIAGEMLLSNSALLHVTFHVYPEERGSRSCRILDSEQKDKRIREETHFHSDQRESSLFTLCSG